MLMLNSAMFVWADFSRSQEKRPKIKETSILYLDERILLEIFNCLNILDLLRVGQACKQWYRISRDYYLWKYLDLRMLRKSFCKENSMTNFLREYPVSRLKNLDLSGLELSGRDFTILATQCPRLRKLVLNSTNLVTKENGSKSFLFPTKLEYLDLRFSNGPGYFYLTVSRHLSSVKWFGACDAFIYALFNDGSLETIIMNMQNLMSLDTSHCQLAKDNLVSMVTSCRNLQVLSMRKCLCLRGYTLDELLSNCKGLVGLILDGTSVDDDVVSSLPWEQTRINYLELGWCCMVSTDGVRVVLEKLSRSKTLGYLGLCSTGNGQAIDDGILNDLKNFFSNGLFCNLRTLNIMSSEKITKNGLGTLIKQCRSDLEVKVGSFPTAERFTIPTYAQTTGSCTWTDKANNDLLTNRKYKNNIRLKKYVEMKQFYLESAV